MMKVPGKMSPCPLPSMTLNLLLSRNFMIDFKPSGHRHCPLWLGESVRPSGAVGLDRIPSVLMYLLV